MTEAAALFADGEAYERLMGRWSKLAGAQFLDWLDTPRGLNWLDVGCGNGAFTEVLIARAAPAAVTAIDPSEPQLAYARTRPGTQRAQFQIADAQALPFADDSFDAAAMALVVAFLSDPAKAVKEMARVVKRDGMVATYMWDFLAGRSPLDPVAVALKALGLPPLSRPNRAASNLDAIRTLWTEAGLRGVETTVIRVRVAYASFDDFWESNTAPTGTSGQVIRTLSPHDRERLSARLREHLPTAADGSIAYDAFANAVKGRAAKA